jgi:general secretion pathway protein A
VLQNIMDVPVFSISPNPMSMYLTQDLKDALKSFRLAIHRRQGLCTILGDNGLGKSTLLRYLATEYENDENCAVSYLPDSRKCKTSFDFLKLISTDFDIPPKRSQRGQMDAIEEFLGASAESGKNVVVFIDEGQRLTLDTFELIRALLNYETETAKLIQFVIAGQVELQSRFLEKKYKPFRSRIMANVEMRPLTADETHTMILYRLDKFNVANPFSTEAIERIFELSGGVPRSVLALCQHSVDAATGEGKSSPTRKVTAADVDHAFRALDIKDPEPAIEAVATAV